MGIFAKMFGSDEVIQAGVDGIDKLVYTDEERSDNTALFLKLYEPFKIAQRYIAMIFCPPYALACFITFCVSFIQDVSAQVEFLQGDFGTIVILIVTFYFGAGAVEGVVNRFSKGK